jgi:predicted enzyme related to lactoylglutathione lyase
MLGNAAAMATIPAEDLNRAKKFYTEVLGLKLAEEPSEGSALFEAGEGSQVFIYQRGRSTAQHTAIHFVVENLEETIDKLTASGVSFEQYDFDEIKTDERGIATNGESRMAWLTDPEGNILGLLSR